MESRDRIAAGLRSRIWDQYSVRTLLSFLTYFLHSFSLQSVLVHFHMMKIGSGNNSQSTCYIPATQRKSNLICLGSSYKFLWRESDLSGLGQEATSGPTTSCCQGLRACHHRATPRARIWMVGGGDGAFPKKERWHERLADCAIAIYTGKRTEISVRFGFESWLCCFEPQWP